MKIGKILLALAFCGGSFMVQANTNATGPNVVKDVNPIQLHSTSHF